MSVSFKDLAEFYENIFKPAYADLVGYIGDRPYDTLVELENALSHIFVALDPNASQSLQEENRKKAYNHLVRASLDCYKLLWVYFDEEIERIFNSDLERLALTISEEEFLRLRNQFKEKAMEARRKELNNVGRNPLQSIFDYREVTEIGRKIKDSIDDSKEGKVRSFRLRAKIRELVASFIIGIITGIIATMICNWWSSAY